MVTQRQRQMPPHPPPPPAARTTPPAPPRAGLAGRVAIVTGVGPSVESGSIENIGLAVARRLLADGCTVVGCDVLDGAAALAAAAAEVAAGDRASFTLCEGTDTAAVRALVAGVAAQNGGAVDLLVCVAGVGVETGGVDTLTEEHMDFVVDVNLKGVMRFNRACVPLMKAAGMDPKSLVLATPETSEIPARAEQGREMTLLRWNDHEHQKIAAEFLGKGQMWEALREREDPLVTRIDMVHGMAVRAEVKTKGVEDMRTKLDTVVAIFYDEADAAEVGSLLQLTAEEAAEEAPKAEAAAGWARGPRGRPLTVIQRYMVRELQKAAKAGGPKARDELATKWSGAVCRGLEGASGRTVLLEEAEPCAASAQTPNAVDAIKYRVRVKIDKEEVLYLEYNDTTDRTPAGRPLEGGETRQVLTIELERANGTKQKLEVDSPAMSILQVHTCGMVGLRSRHEDGEPCLRQLERSRPVMDFTLHSLYEMTARLTVDEGYIEYAQFCPMMAKCGLMHYAASDPDLEWFRGCRAGRGCGYGGRTLMSCLMAEDEGLRIPREVVDKLHALWVEKNPEWGSVQLDMSTPRATAWGRGAGGRGSGSRGAGKGSGSGGAKGKGKGGGGGGGSSKPTPPRGCHVCGKVGCDVHGSAQPRSSPFHGGDETGEAEGAGGASGSRRLRLERETAAGAGGAESDEDDEDDEDDEVMRAAQAEENPLQGVMAEGGEGRSTEEGAVEAAAAPMETAEEGSQPAAEEAAAPVEAAEGGSQPAAEEMAPPVEAAEGAPRPAADGAAEAAPAGAAADAELLDYEAEEEDEDEEEGPEAKKSRSASEARDA